MNDFLKYETISRVSLGNSDKKRRDERQKRPPCRVINVDQELDKLFPPESITVEGEVKTIRASRKQANPFDIYKLKDDLDDVINTTLVNERAGFGKSRLAVHTRVFDELIRQEIIASPERGLLMVAVKDEILGTLKFMEKLQKSSFAFGVTKDLLAQRENMEVLKEISELTEQLNSLKTEMQNRQDQWVERKRQREEEDSLRQIEATFYENQLILSNQQMVNQIEDVIDSEHVWLKDKD